MDLYNLVVSAKISKGGGGGDIDVDALTVTENGVYSASSGHAYSPVTVSVPQSGITPTGTSVITANGLYDVTDFASASVSVPTGVFPSGTSSITSNGIYDITSFASVDVNVSGGGGDHDAEDGLVTRTISTYANSRVTSIGERAFYSFLALATVSFPSVTSIGNYAFVNCTNLTTVSFPNATSIETYAFQYCTKLTTVSFPNATSIGTRAFANCTALMSAYFLASSVAALSNVNAFSSTPMSNSTHTGSFGSIYVPASLVDTYKSATNWSVYADRITSYVE